MKNKNRWILTCFLLGLTIFIHLFSLNSLRVEWYYSTGIYVYISAFMRYLLGWLPFSFGDILYFLLIGWLLWKIIRGTRLLVKKQISMARFGRFFQRILIQFLLVYICFNMLWGMNYNRQGIASQLGLKMEKYTSAELKEVNEVLLKKVNESKKAILQNRTSSLQNREIFGGALEAYKELNKQYSFLYYHPRSVKSSFWGWLGNYTGFLGYYNPITGEAQVNTTVPKFSQPYTTCHEIAHQLGYAKENEANFVGYLAAAASKDTIFHYSVYLDLFLYAARNLSRADTLAARAFARQLLPEVKADLKEWSDFNDRHKNVVEPIIKWIYGKYLENNQQPSGILSYDEVTGFLVAYHKKFGKL